MSARLFLPEQVEERRAHAKELARLYRASERGKEARRQAEERRKRLARSETSGRRRAFEANPPEAVRQMLRDRLRTRSVLSPDGCLLWSGAREVRGYGQIFAGGLLWRTHRAAWVAHRGPITDGLFVLHRCDVRNCINPHHLFLGTQAENVADCMRKGRFRPGSQRRSA